MNKKLSCIIVDDEESSHAVLDILLKKHPEIECLKHCYNAQSAYHFLQNRSCDILFLDINIPDISGFQLLDKLEKPLPYVIFVTAHARTYALEGYKYYDKGLIGFLQKPVSEEELENCLTRYYRISEEQNLLNNIKAILAPTQNYTISVRRKKKELVNIPISEIRYIHKFGNEVFITTDDWCSYSKLLTLNEMMELLPFDLFMQVSKSSIVMINKIISFDGETANMGKNAQQQEVLIPVSKAYTKRLVRLMKNFKKDVTTTT